MIIFSAVRSNGRLGFLGDSRRANVMLTRARRSLVVVGHEETLLRSSLSQRNGIWPAWLRWVRKHGRVVEVDSNGGAALLKVKVGHMLSTEELEEVEYYCEEEV